MLHELLIELRAQAGLLVDRSLDVLALTHQLELPNATVQVVGGCRDVTLRKLLQGAHIDIAQALGGLDGRLVQGFNVLEDVVLHGCH